MPFFVRFWGVRGSIPAPGPEKGGLASLYPGDEGIERDPRVLYKKEGYRFFQEMMIGIRDKVTDLIFRVNVVGQAKAKSAYNILSTQHEEVSSYGVHETLADAELPVGPAGPVGPVGPGTSLGGPAGPVFPWSPVQPARPIAVSASAAINDTRDRVMPLAPVNFMLDSLVSHSPRGEDSRGSDRSRVLATHHRSGSGRV